MTAPKLRPLPEDAGIVQNELVAYARSLGGDAGLLPEMDVVADDDTEELATVEQIERFEVYVRAAFAAEVLTYDVARERIASLAVPWPSARSLRGACSGLLLDLANLGHDDLYRDVAALELELAGEHPTLEIDLRTGVCTVLDAYARGAA